MSDQPPASAEIIQFPSRRPPAPGKPPLGNSAPGNPASGNPASGSDGQERLHRALQNLNEAVAGQRVAVAAWRSTLADLSRVMSGLGESLQRYRGNLDTLGGRVAGLHAQAVQLERIADTAMALNSDRA